MPNVHTTLTSLLTAIANAIRGKTGSSSQIVADDFPDAIDAIPTGTPLPPLTNPAAASDVLDGKEAIDGQGQVLTGSLVPPVDTGANGLYKDLIENSPTELVSEELTILRGYVFYNTPLVKISLPNLQTVGNGVFGYCSNLTGIVDLGNAIIGASCFSNACRRTTIIKCKNNGNSNDSFAGIQCTHLYLPSTEWIGFNYMLAYAKNLKTIQFDVATRISLGYTQSNNLKTFIIKTPTGCTLTSRGSLASDIKYYVPKDILVSFYSTATNWATDYDAGRIVGIDEDTTVTVGTAFTPTHTATDIVSWNMVELQSYSVGTVDTATGAITPTHDGRLLIRGLDSNGNIKHVTYLQIGTGFDEEANLA